MKSEKQMLKAAKILRKAATEVNRFDDREVRWSSTYIPPNEIHKRGTYWVDEHTESPSGGEGYRTVADVVWHLPDAVYIALMQPQLAVLLADLLDQCASDLHPFDGDFYASAVKLAKHVNKSWKERAKRDA